MQNADNQNGLEKDKIKVLIWDLDNTLYRFEESFEHACNIAAAKAAVKNGINMNMDEAVQYGWRSYEKKGHSLTLFIEEKRLDMAAMHIDFHAFIDETIITSCEETKALFQKSPYQNILLTHASRDWAQRTLTHLGLLPFFDEKDILPAEDFAFARKDSSALPFEKALERADYAAENCCVIEDLQRNLRIPKERGMQTGFIHHGRTLNPKPTHIDAQFDHVRSFLKFLNI